MIIDKEAYDYLEHVGVKGMRWGVRNEANRSLNRESRQRDKEKRVATIEKAREKIDSGKAQRDWKKAKAQYKVDKQTIGSREARKKLNKAREKAWTNAEIASQAKNGKEVATTVLLAGAGALTMAVLMGAAGDRTHRF